LALSGGAVAEKSGRSHIASRARSRSRQAARTARLILARRDAGGVRLVTRNGNNFCERFPFVVAAVATLSVRSA